jgi:hypothetical protein
LLRIPLLRSWNKVDVASLRDPRPPGPAGETPNERVVLPMALKLGHEGDTLNGLPNVLTADATGKASRSLELLVSKAFKIGPLDCFRSGDSFALDAVDGGVTDT